MSYAGMGVAGVGWNSVTAPGNRIQGQAE